MGDTSGNNRFIELTANIVSAYLGNNSVASAEIPALINQVHAALLRVASGAGEGAADPVKPAVSVKRSVTPDHIVCLEDGKKFKS
ncbi:MAG: MucR family transcriptional regulator, partial [Xanthobacteraceae bacterium]